MYSMGGDQCRENYLGPLKVRSRSIALGTTTPPPLPPKPPVS